MRRITPVFALTAATMAVGAVLVVAELFRAELYLAAVGGLLWSISAAVRAWKQQATILILHGVRRQVAHLTDLISASLGPSVPAAPAGPLTTAPSTPALTPVQPKTTAPAAAQAMENQVPDRSRKLRQIGVWSPSKASTTRTAGRIAATVASDPDAPFRLFAATDGFGAPEVSDTSPRSLALIGSDALAERLRPHFTVQRLHPRLSAAELEHALPATFVVEEDALDRGPWCGALDPHGSTLLSEVLAAKEWIRRSAGITFVLPATTRTHAAAPSLRADAVVVQHPWQGDDVGSTALMSALLNTTPPAERLA